MANLRTTTDIVQDVIFRVGEPAGQVSAFYPQVLAYVNRAYQSICVGGAEINDDIEEVWWWLRSPSPGTLTLLPSFNTGSIAVAGGSISVTFSVIPVDPYGIQISLARRHLAITGGNGDVYRIASHIAGSISATLDSPYTGQSDTGIAFRAIPLIYDLGSSVDKIIAPMHGFQQWRFDIDGIDAARLAEHYPVNQLWVGEPKAFAMLGERTVQFSHFPGDNQQTDIMRVEYDYTIQAPDLVDDAGATSPLMPFQYNHILSDWACYLLLMDKDDQKSAVCEQMARGGLTAMSKEHRRRMLHQSRIQGKIMPRQDDIKRLQGPLRTSSGLIIG